MRGENVDVPTTMQLSRGVLRDSRRIAGEDPQMVRDKPTDSAGNNRIEIPVPATMVRQPSEIRVLHVDDDPQITELTKTLLEQADDAISVVPETSVVAALQHLQDEEFDCIISDYDMPNTDGLELLEIVRKEHPDLPFILFTGKGSEEIASEAISAGVTDYMQKDSGTKQYEVLANRITNVVDRYRSQQRFWDALSWYRQLVEESFAGVFIVQDGQFVYVNKNLCEIFDYSERELVGASPELIVSNSGDDVEVLEFLSGDPRVSTTFQCSFNGQCSDGTEIPVELNGGTVTYDDAPGYIGILWDQSG